MAQPQVIQGSWEEISAQVEAFKERDDLLLIIPAKKNNQNGAYPSETEEEKEKARIAAIHAGMGKFADPSRPVLASEELRRERQLDDARLERKLGISRP